MFEITVNPSPAQMQAPPLHEAMESQVMEILSLADGIPDHEARARARSALRELLKTLNQVKSLEAYWIHTSQGGTRHGR